MGQASKAQLPTTEIALRWVRPPLQDRSQKTLHRFLEAAESLIAEVGFDKATVAEIAKRADSSVGAFYSRFPDKEALLRCLLDRFMVEAKATMDAALQTELWKGQRVASLCSGLLHFLSSILEERRRFVAALAKASMEDAAFGEFRADLCRHAAEGLFRLLSPSVLGGPRAHGCTLEKSLHVVTTVCFSLLETKAVHGHNRPTGGLPPEDFLDEITVMVVAYLGVNLEALL